MYHQDAIRGRGTGWNPANRFEGRQYEPDGDALDELGAELGEERRPGTVLLDDNSQSILSENDSPDVGFRFAVNPYRGCEHGCVYCYARPTHEYFGYSAGLDFETKIFVKRRAPALLREALASSKWQPQLIAFSGVTDPYQPVERELKLTRQCLEVLLEYRNPVGIVTKNRLVARDADVLAALAEYGCAGVYVSVTTLDLGLNRILEPRTSAPAQRLETIARLRDAGVPVGVLVAPVIPAVNDHEIPEILKACADAGAQFASTIMLRLPYAVAPLFEHWLDAHFPDRKEKVLNRVRAMRGGQLNRSEFGARMRGEGVFADQTRTLFEVACRKHGLRRGGPPACTEHFRRPGVDQLDLFRAV
ncbi:MAG: PA0069 family radical SAM protein [Candidatus Hydrogenedens sp.]|nr:PA0069 family radical SAM protein [Candidatus Hydrogenedens sp.]